MALLPLLCFVPPSSAQPNVVAWGDNTYGQTNVPADLSDAVAVSVGYFHCLAVKADGTVAAWGTSAGTNVPPGLTNVVAVAAGAAFSLALRTDGTVAGWGDNTGGRATPPFGLSAVVAIAAGTWHGLALQGDGTVVAWGSGQSGPAAVPPGLGNVVAIAAGSLHSLALKADGSVVAWGSQTTVPTGLSNVVSIAAGSDRSLALKADGTVTAWGVIYQPPASLTNVLSIATGTSNMVLKADGTVVLWGAGSKTSPGPTNAVAVAAGGYTACYLAVVGNGPPIVVTGLPNRTTHLGATAEFYAFATGTWPLSYQWQFNGTDIPGATALALTMSNVQVEAFGNYRLVVTNSQGSNVGPGATLSLLPVFMWGTNTAGQANVCGGLPTVRAVAAGYWHCLALRTNGTVVGWGANDYGQAAVPVGLTNVTAISAGDFQSLALRADGTIAAWGRTPYTNVPASLTNAAAVSAGYDHSLALGWDGGVVSWDGVSGSQMTFVPFGLTNVVAVAAGNAVSLALKADGTLVYWTRSSLLSVPAGMANVVAIAAGDKHYLALRADGTVVAWGSNSYGQTNVPADLTNVVTISAGYSHNLALKADGTVVAWGSPGSVPPGLTNLVQVAAGQNYSLALAGDGLPSLAAPLVNRSAFVGGTAFFYATALGGWPASYQWQFNGTNIVGASDRLLVLSNVQPANAGVYAVVVTNSQGAITSAPAMLRVEDFGLALDATNLTWTTFGDAAWFTETNTCHIGNLAAQSGSLRGSSYNGADSKSTLETTMTGPGTLTFWWKASCPQPWMYLSLSVNGAYVASISGSVDWEQQTVYLGLGTQVIDWVFASGLFVPTGLNAGWVDGVNFSPGVVPPSLTSQPLSQSQALGADVTLNVGVTGTPPFSYQWMFNGTNIPGSTAASCTLTNIQGSNVGNYSVLVRNAADGVQSSNAAVVLGRIAGWGTTVPVNITNAVVLAGGLYHVLALQPDGTVLAWGIDNCGQTDVPAGLTNVLGIAGGGWFSLALKADGSVVAWGDNSSGQTNVPAGLTSMIAVAGGFHHALALKADGTVACWGDNAYGETNIPAGLTNVVAITAGFGDNLALKADGTVVAWGNNSLGQTNVPASLTNVVSISACDDHCLALSADGTLATWGNSAYGLTNTPADLTNPAAIATGMYLDLALKVDGTVAAWGWNLGGDTVVPAGLRNVVAVASGGYHSVALQGSGPPALTAPLGTPTWSSNTFSVVVPTQSRRVYRLEYCVSLDGSSWVALPLFPGTGRSCTLTDPAPSDAQRFYRVRQW